MTNRNDYRAHFLRSEFDAGRVLAGDAPLPALKVLDVPPRAGGPVSEAAPSYYSFNERKADKVRK